MRTKLLILAACVFTGVGAWAADSQRFSSRDAPRASTATGYVDFWSVKTGSLRVLSIFGYNSGAQQWVQLYDTTASAVTISVSGFSSTFDWLTNSGNNNLAIGEPIQFTNTIGGLTAGIYYAVPFATNRFGVVAAQADALVTSPVILDLSGSSATATINRVPVHTMAVASQDNFSLVVPNTGMGFGRGLLIANSTTGPTWTVGGTNLTLNVTLGGP